MGPARGRIHVGALAALWFVLPGLSLAQQQAQQGYTQPQDPMNASTFTTPNQTATPPADANAASGQAYGSGLYPNAKSMVNADTSTGSFTVPGAGNQGMTADQLFQGSAGGNVSDYTGLYGNNAALQSAAAQAKSSAAADSTGAHGKAYNLVSTAPQRAHPDLTKDPLWVQTDYVNSNMASIVQQFADCHTVTTVTPTTTTAHVPDLQTCQRSSVFSGQDTLTHSYTVNPALVLQSVSSLHGPCAQSSAGYDCTQFQGSPVASSLGNAPVTSCGSDCLLVQIGSPSPFQDADACITHIEQITLQLPVPAAITSAVLTSVSYDDRALITVNGAQVFQGSGGVQIPSGVTCDPAINASSSPNTDLTSWFTAGNTLTLAMYVENGGGGRMSAIVEVHYNKDALVNDQGWGSSGAVQMANVAVGCPSGSITITSQPPLDSNGCAQFNNDLYCPTDFPPSPVPGLSPLMYQANVQVSNCGANLGSAPCRTLMDGSTYCPNNNANNTSSNNCTQYSSNPQCAYESTTCLYADSQGDCLVAEDTYDCGQDVQVPGATKQTLLNCQGTLPCVGQSCSTKAGGSNNSFGNVVGALSAIKAMSKNGVCDNAGNCTVFPSTAGSCHETVGGLVNDCCHGKTGASLKTFMDLSLSVMGDQDASNRLSYEDPTHGSWSTLSGGGIFGQTDVQQPVATQLDTTTGSTSQNTSGSPSTQQQNTQQCIADNAHNQVQSQLGSTAANQMFQQKSNGHWSFSSAASGSLNMADGFMAAYMTWEVTLAVLNYIAPCQSDEFKTVSKVNLKACHFLGTKCMASIFGLCVESKKVYCCFSSPLGRIVSEQVYPQLGISWGDANNPNCTSGIPVSALSKVDWSKVDFSEYVGILQQTGHLPDPTNPSNLSITSLTATNSSQNCNGTRQDATARANQRVYDMNPESNRQVTDQALWGNNPTPSSPVSGTAPPPTTGP